MKIKQISLFFTLLSCVLFAAHAMDRPDLPPQKEVLPLSWENIWEEMAINATPTPVNIEPTNFITFPDGQMITVFPVSVIDWNVSFDTQE